MQRFLLALWLLRIISRRSLYYCQVEEHDWISLKLMWKPGCCILTRMAVQSRWQCSGEVWASVTSCGRDTLCFIGTKAFSKPKNEDKLLSENHRCETWVNNLRLWRAICRHQRPHQWHRPPGNLSVRSWRTSVSSCLIRRFFSSRRTPSCFSRPGNGQLEKSSSPVPNSSLKCRSLLERWKKFLCTVVDWVENTVR